MDNYMVQGGNAWDAQSFDGKFGSRGEQHRDKYFEKDDKGFYQLKDGYEQRYLGEKGFKGGAEMVYSNDYDDLESPEDARYYGVFKTPEPKTVTKTVHVDKPAPEAKEIAKPIQLSNRAAEAKAYTRAYEQEMLPRQGNFAIENDQSVVDDFKTEYKLQLGQAKQPYMADGSDVPSDQKQESTDYANDYKKAVADLLVPRTTF